MHEEMYPSAPVRGMVFLVMAASCAPPAVAAPRKNLSRLTVTGAEIEVEFGAGPCDRTRDELLAWVSAGAQAAIAYYGRFPVARYRLLVEVAPGAAGVMSGTTWADGGAHSRVVVGEHTTARQLAHDWVMTHEMIHTSFPDQPAEHHWIEEGIATYAEPLGRLWAGHYAEAQVWADLVDGLPNGLPADGDQGLDHTATWGRTYWGGALFCLLADLEIRTRTAGKKGLVDALRGVLAAGGNDQVDWSLAHSFAVGDQAIGVPVLTELYGKMKDAPVTPDLAALWRELGVAQRDGKIAVDDTAPKAALRRSITARP
jgi:hypothetical protein